MFIFSLSLLCFSTLFTVSSLNILVHSPAMGASHMNFMARLADTLTEAGHDVTFLVPAASELNRDRLGVRLTKDVIVVESDEEMKKMMRPRGSSSAPLWRLEIRSANIEKMFSWFIDTMILSCENFLRHENVIEKLKTRHFDVAIAEPFSSCGLALFEALKIRKTILVSSCTHIDLILPHIGEPEEFSWVPSLLSQTGDTMNLMEKWENYQLVQENKKSFNKLFEAEKLVYRMTFGSQISDWKDLMASASMVFTNSIPYLDYPRATIQKTINIGGITVDLESIKSEKLEGIWDRVLSQREKTILISFGSIMLSAEMPVPWRSSILNTIASMPNVTFIWKYESDDVSFASRLNNIHFSKWVPQTVLLADPRLSGFLTHGGLGSANELAHLGKPAIMVPIFGDQTRNANMLARHGSVIVLNKKDLGDVEKVKHAVRSILYEETYMENAKRIAEMLKNQPTNPKETVVKYTEFVAKFGPFPQMDPYGRKLNYFQKTFLDIYLTVLGVLLVFLIFVFVVIQKLLNCFKVKKE